MAVGGARTSVPPSLAPDERAQDAAEKARRAALTAAMDRHADGDAAAFGEVYDLLAPRLEAYLLRQSRDRALAEDLVQQTLLQMHTARASFAKGSDVVPWAYAIGRRLFLDTRRKRSREVLVDATPDDGSGGRVSVELPDEVASTRQLATLVQEELAKMPEPQRIAYELVRDEGLSVAEAADVLGTTTGAVKQRAFRVYEALRSALSFGSGEKKRKEQR
jgi:RNA polymerase sigma-70 factor (ECF subfamily)